MLLTTRRFRGVSLALFTFALCSRAANAQVPGELRGRITDSEAARPIAGARIEVVGHTVQALSAVDGTFVMRGLDPRALAVHVRAFGYAAGDTTIVIANGRAVMLDMELHPVASRLEAIVVQARRDATAGLSFDRRAIERSGRRDLGELLLTAPGVVVTQSGGPGSPSRISIRGSGADEVLVLLDGNPINSAISGEANLSRINLETVEHVTVLRGAQSAQYGGRALAGVVLIETRRGEQEMSGALSIGAWGERNAALTTGRANVRDAIRTGGSITGDYRDYAGDFTYEIPAIRGGGAAHRENGDARSGGALASAFVEGTRGRLQVRSQLQSESRGTPGSIVQPSLTGHERDARFTGGLDGRWAFGTIIWTANADATHEHMRLVDTAPPFGIPYDENVDASSGSFRTTATAGSAFGSLALGGEARALSVTSTMLDVDAPPHRHQIGTWLSARAARSVASRTELSADATTRVDWDTFIHGAVLSPRAGFTLSHGRASISTSVGAGYAPPSLADQFFHEGVLVRPNPDLRPERVRNEVEVRAALRDARVGAFDVGGELAAYRADIDGMILWQPDFRFIWSPANFDVRRSGWEASGRVALSSLGADVHASLSKSDVSYEGPVLSGQVGYRPHFTANVTAALTRWSTRAEVATRYVGERRTVAGSALNVLEPYSLADIKLSRRFGYGAWQLDATVGVNNMLDRHAAMLVDYPFPGRAWTVAFRTRRRDDRTLAGAVAVQR